MSYPFAESLGPLSSCALSSIAPYSLSVLVKPVGTEPKTSRLKLAGISFGPL
jgi:hypothetical protein